MLVSIARAMLKSEQNQKLTAVIHARRPWHNTCRGPTVHASNVKATSSDDPGMLQCVIMCVA
jgi:hypothetical protein